MAIVNWINSQWLIKAALAAWNLQDLDTQWFVLVCFLFGLVWGIWGVVNTSTPYSHTVDERRQEAVQWGIRQRGDGSYWVSRNWMHSTNLSETVISSSTATVKFIWRNGREGLVTQLNCRLSVQLRKRNWILQKNYSPFHGLLSDPER